MPLTANEIIAKARQQKAERIRAEQARLEAEKLQREKEERERKEAEEKARLEAERLQREKEERARKETEEKIRLEKERAEQERLEAERLQREKEERERKEAEWEREFISKGFVKVNGKKFYCYEWFTVPSFYISKFEVTQEEYKAVMSGQIVNVDGETYLLDSMPSYFRGERLPVETVTWFDAVYYCNARSKQEGFSKAYNIKVKKIEEIDAGNHITDAEVTQIKEAAGYRLPTEIEWEYAARGGKPDSKEWNFKYSGSNNLNKVGWYMENSDDKTHPVGLKRPNSLGLYDMTGNVYEWCYDDYDISKNETNQIISASSSRIVSRGGSYEFPDDWCRMWNWHNATTNRKYPNPRVKCSRDWGFRVVRSVCK